MRRVILAVLLALLPCGAWAQVNYYPVPYDAGGPATWGLISGTLSAQSDLSSALAAKCSLGGCTMTGPFLQAAGSLAAPSYSFSGATSDGMRWVSGAFGGIYIHSDGPYLNIELDPGHDSTGSRSAITFHTTNGTNIIHTGSASDLDYATTTWNGNTPSLTNYVRNSGGDVNQVTQSATKTTFSKAIVLQDGGTKPTCDVTVRGMVWFDAGAGGVADTVEVCGKAAADTYSWVALATF